MAVGLQTADRLDLMHRERLRLLNAVDHLVQSNEVLEEVLVDDPDPQLREAIGVRLNSGPPSATTLAYVSLVKAP